MTFSDISWTELVLFSIQTCGTIATFALSSIYHTFECHETWAKWLFLDILGMIIGAITIHPAFIYYGWWHEPCWALGYAAAYLVAVGFSIWDAMVTPDGFVKRRVKWMGFWVCGWYTMLTFHIKMTGTDGGAVDVIIPYVMFIVMLAAIIAFVYLTKFPESVFVGKLDIIGQSHHVWHILIFLISVTTLNVTLTLANARIESDSLKQLIT